MSKGLMQSDLISIPATDEDEGSSSTEFSKKTHQFYFVKFWPYKDPEKDSKLQWADQQCQQLDREKERVVDYKIMEIMSRRDKICSELDRKKWRHALLETGVEWTTMVVGFLRAAIDKLDVNGSSSSTHQPRFLMSSLRNEIPRAFFWYSQSNNREKFEQILKQVEQMEDRLDEAKAAAATKGNIWDPLSSVKAMEEQIEVLNKIPDELRPERHEVMAEIKCLEDGLEALKKEDDELSKNFQALIDRKSDLLDFVVSARREEDEANGSYNEYVSLMRNANELARRKDVKALEQLSSRQVDKFMRRWNDSQSFRTTYEKALLWSLHYRELSKDGLIRNEDEEPIVENGEIHKQFLHLVSIFLTLFMVLDERNKMLR
ncbi:proton pump-interactor BIP131-like [Hibiscus syriacus]|uniref:proton pump-interactor BIP131-like n=1 Tax=Hibiscus syriacus TaxID=106335 RepID=UPI001922193A|nr:proton pump-interactor BIP131-like [Hibiscus syriacus]